MDVENPKLAVADVPKAVKHSDGYGHPCSCASMDDVITKPELSLSFKNIERINVVGVGVWVNAESGAKASIDDFELGQLGEYPVVPLTTGIFSPSSGAMRMAVIDGVSRATATDCRGDRWTLSPRRRRTT